MNRITLVSGYAVGTAWFLQWSDGSRMKLRAPTPQLAREFVMITLRDARV